MLVAFNNNGLQIREVPAAGWEDDQWIDFSDTEQLYAWIDRHNYIVVQEAPRPADTDTTKFDAAYSSSNGQVTQEWVARPWTAEELDAKAQETTRTSLDQRVRDAVAKGGTLDTDIGSTNTAWVPGTALTLRNYKAMTLAQIKALNLAQTQELLSKLAPLLVDIAVATKRSGKLSLKLYDEI